MKMPTHWAAAPMLATSQRSTRSALAAATNDVEGERHHQRQQGDAGLEGAVALHLREVLGQEQHHREQRDRHEDPRHARGPELPVGHHVARQQGALADPALDGDEGGQHHDDTGRAGPARSVAGGRRRRRSRAPAGGRHEPDRQQATPPGSRRASGSRSNGWCTNRFVSQIASSASGMLTANTSRQLAAWVSAPPISGPIALPTPATPMTSPPARAAPRRRQRLERHPEHGRPHQGGAGGHRDPRRQQHRDTRAPARRRARRRRTRRRR